MHPLIVLNIVGLTPGLIGPHTPNLARLAASGALRPLRTVLPAVTCSAQATFLTGLMPSGHGAVGNGWLFRDLMEVWFWRQSNRLLSGERLWDAAKARDPDFTCANLFWWFAMASSADFTVTPRPIDLIFSTNRASHPSTGRKGCTRRWCLRPLAGSPVRSNGRSAWSPGATRPGPWPFMSHSALS